MHHILKTYLLITVLGISHSTTAEVVLDGTLGRAGALIKDDNNFAIEAHFGQQVGNNLFHSFETFNINQSESAIFSGPETINNIISRVTGGQVSNINGVLASTIPDADMYLINPAGIVFGEHGSLDVKGSFHASTANYLLLGQNGRFDASHPENSLLTVAPPSAFGFLDESPAGIETYGSLTVANGKGISLIAGDLNLQDSHLIAPGGQINLVSVASSGEAPVDQTNILDNAFDKFGTIKIIDKPINHLKRKVNIDVSDDGGGRVYILGEQIFMENVYVFADTKGAKNGQGITIKASDKFIAKRSFITADAVKNSTGKGGYISITARDINLSYGTRIITNTDSSSDAGNITLIGTEKIKIDGLSTKLQSSTDVNSTGKGGKIHINAPIVILEDSSEVLAKTHGHGNAGDIFFKVNRLILKKGAQVSVNTQTTNKGKGGNLIVKAKESIQITGKEENGSGFFSNTFSAGEGGSIDVQTILLEIHGKGTIQAGSEKYGGNAGNITLNVDQLGISQGGSITTETLGNGMGGEIDIQAHKISIADKGIITASSSGTGNAGNIKITSPGYLYLTNSEITTSVSANNGNGGNIILDPEFIILDNSYIKANAFEGKGGEINITTTGIYNFSEEPIKDIITAISINGLDGLVTINYPEIDISSSLTQILAKTFLDAASLLRKQCATRSGLNLSGLSIIRGDVVPKDPMDLRNHSMQLAAPGFKPCHVSNAPQLH